MKKKSQIISALLITSMLMSGATVVMAEETGTPRISEETITLTLAGPSGAKAEDWESTIQFQEYEKRLGIKFDATTYTDEQWGSKFTLMLASDEMPDLVSMPQVPMTRADLEKYAADGYFLDFSQYLDIMPNLVRLMEEFPEYKNAVTASDGGIYGFTFLNSRDPGAKLMPIYMSQKWLDNVGMERPSTLDELYEVLKAFKEQDANGNGDPDDEIPMGMSCSTAASWQNELPILWAYGINSDIYSYHRKGNEDGTVELWDISENYKEFLKYMNKLYEEELINQDAYVIDPTELQSIAAEDRIGYHAFNSLLGKLPITDPYEFYGVVGMTSDYNSDTSIVIEAAAHDTYRLVANAETEYPEEIAKFVDYLLTDEGVTSAVNGYEGLSFEFKEVAGYQVTDLTGFAAEAGMETETYRTTVALGRGAFSMGAIARGTIFDMLANIDLDQILEEECWGPSTVNALKVLSYRENPDIVIMDRFPSLTYTEEELKEYSILYTDINNYLKTAKAQFITGEMDIDTSWDAHIEKLKEMGLERLLEIESAAYARNLAK